MKQHKLDYIRFARGNIIAGLLPIVMICSIIFGIQSHEFELDILGTMKRTSERESIYWNQQLTIMNTYNNACRYNKIYHPDYADDWPITQINIMQDLKEKESNFPFIDRIYLFVPLREQVVTSNGIYQEDTFFQDVLNIDPTFIQLQTKEMFVCVSHQNNGKEIMMLVFPMRAWGEQNSTQYFFYVLSQENLNIQLGLNSLEYQNSTQLYFNDTLLYHQNSLPSNQAVWTYQHDMGNGFSIIHQVPKSLYLSSVFPYLQGYFWIIVSSATVSLLFAFWVTRKPYHAFQNIMGQKKELEAERTSLQQEKYLYKLLHKTITPGDDLWNKCLAYGIDLNRKYKFFIILPYLTGHQLLTWIEAPDSLNNITVSYPIFLFEDILIYFVCSDQKKELLEQQLQQFRQEYGTIGVGNFCTDISTIRTSFQQAKQDWQNVAAFPQKYPKTEMDSFKEAVKQGDSIRCDVLLENLIEHLSQLQTKPTVATCLMWDMVQTVGGDPSFIYNLDFSDFSVDLQSFRHKIKQSMSQNTYLTSQDQIEKTIQKKNFIDLLTYIHNHYLDENFSVKYIAAEFNTSVSNISHFFKKNQNMSISQYVETIKMEKARELLQFSELKISDIASMLQYSSSTVFIEVFKRQLGVTPGAYRAQMKKQENKDHL